MLNSRHQYIIIYKANTLLVFYVLDYIHFSPFCFKKFNLVHYAFKVSQSGPSKTIIIFCYFGKRF